MKSKLLLFTILSFLFATPVFAVSFDLSSPQPVNTWILPTCATSPDLDTKLIIYSEDNAPYMLLWCTGVETEVFTSEIPQTLRIIECDHASDPGICDDSYNFGNYDPETYLGKTWVLNETFYTFTESENDLSPILDIVNNTSQQLSDNVINSVSSSAVPIATVGVSVLSITVLWRLFINFL